MPTSFLPFLCLCEANACQQKLGERCSEPQKSLWYGHRGSGSSPILSAPHTPRPAGGFAWSIFSVHLVGLESCRNEPLSVSMVCLQLSLFPPSLCWSPELNKRESNLGTGLYLSPSPDCGLQLGQQPQASEATAAHYDGLYPQAVSPNKSPLKLASAKG